MDIERTKARLVKLEHLGDELLQFHEDGDGLGSDYVKGKIMLNIENRIRVMRSDIERAEELANKPPCTHERCPEDDRENPECVKCGLHFDNSPPTQGEE